MNEETHRLADYLTHILEAIVRILSYTVTRLAQAGHASFPFAQQLVNRCQ